MAVRSEKAKLLFFAFSQSLLLLALMPGGMAAASQIASGAPNGPAERRTVTAVRTREKMTLDGNLSEPVWQKTPPATDFVQTEPYPGRPATEKTEVRVVYDDDTIYIGAICFDSQPERITTFDLKRDFETEETDVFGLILDTFHDRRNGFAFLTNPAGAKRELQAIDDGRDVNVNWEGIWSVKTRKRGDSWVAEIAIPFKTLRFEQKGERVWGINFLRRVRQKNEIAYWSPVPLRFQLQHVSYAGELLGLTEARQGRNLKVKPFVLADFHRQALTRKAGSEAEFDGGVDSKYGLTAGMTLDLTYNTDFSQVEVDEQQTNLTRFALFFPEKREFFLENAGLFQFGEVTKAIGPPRDPETYLFFSRRIGLSSLGEEIPILGGARLSGRQGNFGLGLLNIQTRDSDVGPGQNFTVVRVKRQILARSDVGAIFINRGSEFSSDHHRAFGADANFRFFQNWRINSFVAKTETPGKQGKDLVGKIATDWADRHIDFFASYMDAGENFKPDVGYVRRTGIRLSQLEGGYHYRPRKSRIFRDIILFKGVLEYTTDRGNRPVTKLFRPIFRIWFHDGSVFEITGRKIFERLDRPFQIRPQVPIPAGDYYFDEISVMGNTNKSRKLSADVRFTTGDFYNGTKSTLFLSFIYRPTYKLSAAIRYDGNSVHLPIASFRTDLLGVRLNYAFSTRLFLNAFIQYNSDTGRVSSNVRFNFIHRPMSDFFIVYNEQRDLTAGLGTDRSLTLKYTHLLDF